MEISMYIYSWSIIEIIFYLFVRYIIVPKLQPLTEPQPYYFKDPKVIIREMYQNFLNIKSCTFGNFLMGYHLYKESEDKIYSKNFESFLAWCLYRCKINELNENQLNEVNLLSEEAFNHFNIPDKGFNAKIEHCQTGCTPFNYIHRPLILYCLINFIEIISNEFILKANNFNRYKINNTITYWYFKHSTSNKPPIAIFHGISSGWVSYRMIIKTLCKDRSILLIDYNCIKLNSMSFHVPGPLEMKKHFEDILLKHNIDKVSILAHSFGSFLAGWVVKLCSKNISHLTLVDPSSLFICYPETNYEMCHKESKTFQDYLLNYFVRNDLTISYTVDRHFAWYLS
jgi:hypothetical protein